MLKTIVDTDYDRRKFIGGSNVGAIIGVSPHATPLDVYLAKVEGETVVDDKDELFLRRRKRFEGPIFDMLREEFDAPIVATNQRYLDGDYEFIASEIDFEYTDPDDGQVCNGEVKTVGAFNFGEAHGWGEEGSDQIPLHYAAQVQWGLGVTGRRKTVVAALVGLDTMRFYMVPRDDDVILALRERCARFWHENVLARVPPPPVNLDDMLRIATTLKGRPVQINDSTLQLLQRLHYLREVRKQAEKEGDEIRERLLGLALPVWQAHADEPDAERAAFLYHGQTMATYNAQITRRIDVDRLRQELPDVAAHYTVPSISRVLRLTKALTTPPTTEITHERRAIEAGTADRR